MILDPGAKTGALYRMMSKDEADERMIEGRQFIQAYVKEYNSSVDLRNSRPVEKQVTLEAQDLIFDRVDFQAIPSDSHAFLYGEALNLDDDELMEEFYDYLREPLLKNRSKEPAIAWWYQHRNRFSKLFPLAISLFYTKVSSCEVERTISLASRVMRKDRTRLSSRNFKSIMLLRDGFERFGFYKIGPTALRNVCNGKYDIYENNDELSDPLELYASSDDTLCDSDAELSDENSDHGAAGEVEEVVCLGEPNSVHIGN